MELTFLGTSAGVPTRTRNVTGLAVRDGRHWDLFDCGEGTQHQILRTRLTIARLANIFISHLHGDHVFGLFGILTSRSMDNSATPLDLYGPEGIADMVDTVLRTSASHLGYELRIHEVDPAGGEVLADHARVITAVPLDHRVTSFGWWIRERERPGRFDAAHAEALGVEPGPAFGQLQRGATVTTAEGRTVRPDEVMEPPRPGRNMVIAGDNADPAALLASTPGATVLVHEATFSEASLARSADDFGHSTASRTATAAAQHGIEHLVLTHFSPRFTSAHTGSESMETIRHEALAALSTAPTPAELILAEDFMRLAVDPAGAVSVLTTDT